MQDTTVTYKEWLCAKAPYLQSTVLEYLDHLENQLHEIHGGKVGIYVAREIKSAEQSLYFPYLDIDGDSRDGETAKIESALQRTKGALQYFGDLEVLDRFRVIATGGTGFRLVSNVLLNKVNYEGFINFVTAEIQCADPGPLRDIYQPHQLLAYKGSCKQCHHPVRRHSCPVDAHEILNGYFNGDRYLEATNGKPNPDEYVEFMEWFLNFRPITDLGALGKLGSRISQYAPTSSRFNINPSVFQRMAYGKPSLTMERLSEELMKRGIHHRIEPRGPTTAISFQNLPCPVCHKTGGNARAYPPYFRLYCLRRTCEANQGMSLPKWSGIDSVLIPREKPIKRGDTVVDGPENSLPLEEAKLRIRDELEQQGDSLIIVTPGVGKTHSALEWVRDKAGSKVIVYSSLNKALKEEAYDRCKGLGIAEDHLHMLHARDEVCTRPNRLLEVCKSGYSPANLLCNDCGERGTCAYYQERGHISNGVHFVTHAMLPYLTERLEKTDLIILDENLLAGFLVEETITGPVMRALKTTVGKNNQRLIQNIIDLADDLKGAYENYCNRQDDENGATDFHTYVSGRNIVHLLQESLRTQGRDFSQEIDDLVRCLQAQDNQDLLDKGIDARAIEYLNDLNSNPDHVSIRVSKDSAIFQLKKIDKLNLSHTKIKILDATGDKDVAEIVTGRQIRPLKAKVNWDGKRIHLKHSTSRTTLQHSSGSDLEKLAKDILEHTKAKRILVITHKFLLERLLQECQKQEPDRQFMGHHFFGPKGVNAYQDCDAAIVVGLPYENLESNRQNAGLIYGGDDEEKCQQWMDQCMQNELLQAIHRIRPVRKPHTDIILAASLWPTVLDEPNQIIDNAHNDNWKEQALMALRPWVKTFGFMNDDIAALAGIVKRGKEKSARLFRESVINYLKDLNPKGVLNLRTLNKKRETKKNGLPLLFYESSGSLARVFFGISVSSMPKHPLPYLDDAIENAFPIVTLSPNQSTQVKNTFIQENSEFETFKTKLKHRGNQWVKGIGIQAAVCNFYNRLHELQIIEHWDQNCYRTERSASNPLPNLPADTVTINFSENCVSLFNSALGIHICEKDDLADELQSTSGIQKVITNDAKSFYVALGKTRLEYDVHDTSLVQKILDNGKRYMQKTDNDDFGFSACVSLYATATEQTKECESGGLNRIVEIKKSVTFILASIEEHGIKVDQSKLNEILDSAIEDDNTGLGKHDIDFLKIVKEQIGSDDRIHNYINQTTLTGRMSCFLHGTPKKPQIRSLFVPDDGKVFIVADYKQFEMRVLAYSANVKRMIGAWENNRDVYEEYRDELNTVGIGMDRGRAKSIMLSISNGANAWGLVNHAGMVLSEAKKAIHIYHSMFPEVQTWKDTIIQEAREQGFVKTAFGRIRYIQEDTTNRQIVNFRIQGTASDGFKVAVVNAGRNIAGKDASLVHLHHDEVIVEAPQEIAAEASSGIQQAMETAFVSVYPGARFEVTINTVRYWN